MSLIFLVAILFILLLIGVPVGFAIGGATIAAVYCLTTLDMSMVAQYSFSGVNSVTLVAVPFFMLAGIIMSKGGIAKRIVDFAQSLVGFVTGGLGAVSIIACMFFGALSGSGMATTSAIGSMLIPEMSEKGYQKEYAATLVCFGGIVGPIIPPSISFIMYGSIVDVSIGDLFIAGIIPGILIGLLMIATNYIMCRRHHMGAKVAMTTEVTVGEMLKQRLIAVKTSFLKGIWALLSPIIILGGIYAGVFSPTEAAVVSVVYSILVSLFIYKDMNLKDLYDAFVDAAVLNGITTFLLGYSTVFSVYLAYAQIPDMIAGMLETLADNKIILLLLINLILLVMGCFLDTIPAIVIMAPILLPTVQMIGMDPIHFGVVMAVNLAVGLCTPPYGCNLFVGAAVARIKMESMFRFIWPLLLTTIISLLLITFIPQLSLALL